MGLRIVLFRAVVGLQMNIVERKNLAYCVNIFFNPFLKRYFEEHGCVVDEDKYALSEMIQWIWRSAIRDGHEINIYIQAKECETS